MGYDLKMSENQKNPYAPPTASQPWKLKKGLLSCCSGIASIFCLASGTLGYGFGSTVFVLVYILNWPFTIVSLLAGIIGLIQCLINPEVRGTKLCVIGIATSLLTISLQFAAYLFLLYRAWGSGV